MRVLLVMLFAIAMLALSTGCGSSGGAPAARTTHATGTRPAATTRPSAPAQTFVSNAYHFRVALTKEWSASDATVRWNGSELAGVGSPTFARFIDPAGGHTLLVAAAPVGPRLAKGLKLGDWRAAMVHAAPAVCHDSASATKTTLGGEPALRWTANCEDGYHVNKLAALHGSHGYVVLLASQVAASDDAESRSVFQSMRRSFRFTR